MQVKSLPSIKNSDYLEVYSSGDCSTSSSMLSLSNERLCRICRETDEKGDLHSHCHCRGSVGLVHTSCLLFWIKKSGSAKCEICKQNYDIIAQINKRFWQWKLPRIGTKGWFKLVFFAGFLSMLVAFTVWIIWSRTSSSTEAKQERNKKQVEYSYVVYGMLVLIAIVGMYALNIRPFSRFLSRCLVMNQNIVLIPNGELCKDESSSTEILEELGKENSDQSRKHSSHKNQLSSLRDTYVQVQAVEDTNFALLGYSKLAGPVDMV